MPYAVMHGCSLTIKCLGDESLGREKQRCSAQCRTVVGDISFWMRAKEEPYLPGGLLG